MLSQLLKIQSWLPQFRFFPLCCSQLFQLFIAQHKMRQEQRAIAHEKSFHVIQPRFVFNQNQRRNNQDWFEGWQAGVSIDGNVTALD